MAKERAKYNIRSISEDDLESAGDACYQAFNNLAQQARLLTPHADFENVDIAIGVIRSKLQKLSDGVDGIVAVDSEGKVLGGCFGEVMG